MNQSKRTRRNRRTSKPKRQMGGGDAYEFVRDVVPTCLNVIVQCVDPNFKAKAGPAVGQAISILYTLKGLVCRCTVEGASYAVSVIGVFLNALDNMVGGWPGIIAKCFMTVAKLCVVAIPTQDIGTGKNLQVPDKVKEAARETLAELERRRSRVDASMRAVQGLVQELVPGLVQGLVQEPQKSPSVGAI